MDIPLHQATMRGTMQRVTPRTARRLLECAVELPTGVLPTDRLWKEAERGLLYLTRRKRRIERQGVAKSAAGPHVLAVLEELVSFADIAKGQDRYRQTGSYHYANIPLDADLSSYKGELGRLVRGGELLRALPRYVGQIDGNPTETAALALAMAIHLLGDVCTVGHVFCRVEFQGPESLDGGLNFFPVRLCGKGTQLHAVFDGEALWQTRGWMDDLPGGWSGRKLRGATQRNAIDFWAGKLMVGEEQAAMWDGRFGSVSDVVREVHACGRNLVGKVKDMATLGADFRADAAKLITHLASLSGELVRRMLNARLDPSDDHNRVAITMA